MLFTSLLCFLAGMQVSGQKNCSCIFFGHPQKFDDSLDFTNGKGVTIVGHTTIIGALINVSFFREIADGKAPGGHLRLKSSGINRHCNHLLLLYCVSAISDYMILAFTQDCKMVFYPIMGNQNNASCTKASFSWNISCNLARYDVDLEDLRKITDAL